MPCRTYPFLRLPNDAPISIADGNENVPKKYSLHSLFWLTPCYLLLLFFGYHISSAMSPVGIFVFPFQFAKVSAVFHALSQSLNLPYYAIQFSSVQLGTGSGSVQFRCEPMCADLTASVAMWKLWMLMHHDNYNSNNNSNHMWLIIIIRQTSSSSSSSSS